MTTARDVVKGALRLIGVISSSDEPTAEEADDALTAMNQMLASWATSRFTVASMPQTSFALTSGDGTYTIGASGDINTTRPTTIYEAHITQGGYDYPLELIALEEYERIADKASAGDVPQFMAIRPGYPLSTIHLYPLPGSGCTLVIDKVAPPTDLTLNDTMPYPPEWMRAIRYNLAIELAPEYGSSVPAEIVAIADQSLSVIRRTNLQMATAQLDPLLMSRQGSIPVSVFKAGLL